MKTIYYYGVIYLHFNFPDKHLFRKEKVRSTYLNSEKVKVKWDKPLGDFDAITLQQCQKETKDIMHILECHSGTITRGCRCYDVTYNSLYRLKSAHGLWLTFTAWDRNNPNVLMYFTYKMPGWSVSFSVYVLFCGVVEGLLQICSRNTLSAFTL